MATDGRVFRIAHISDLHCGGPYFEASLLERAISEVNELEPDVVVCSGDLTTFGFRHEYLTAREYLDRIICESMVVVPGNHDSRNVGFVHFEEMFGDRNSVLAKDGIAIVAIDSSEPDLDHGQIGRGRYRWIEEQFAQEPAELKIFVFHHHLLQEFWAETLSAKSLARLRALIPASWVVDAAPLPPGRPVATWRPGAFARNVPPA